MLTIDKLIEVLMTEETDDAGMRAVVRALRDEIMSKTTSDPIWDLKPWFNKILGDAGSEKVAGACADGTVVQRQRYGENDRQSKDGAEVSPRHPDPATDPAPACEWWVERDPDGDGHYETKCQNGWTLLHGKPSLDGYSFCPSCGLPIKFTEAKT